MSNDIVIQVNNLSKAYTIRHQARDNRGAHNYRRFSEDLSGWAAWPFRKLLQQFGKNATPPNVTPTEQFWALLNISFKVRRGEIVGIIGRNGAGKSTLLKILSRITEPTTGRVDIDGRVASLLEVGTGFHPELTGLENIFLNGAILGMSKNEIKRKLDEIVAFAEVEKFLYTVVKHYSSGMYMRLAFAVAAHLEPEILIVDEVLAVGDAAFQKKCLGKMGEVANNGRTVLLVSHNMQAIRKICEHAILIDKGVVVAAGKTDSVMHRYLQSSHKADNQKELETMISKLPFDRAFCLENVRLLQSGQVVTNILSNGEPLEIEIQYRVLERTTGLRVYFDLCDSDDILLFRSFNDEQTDGVRTVDPGRYISRGVINADLLAPIDYELRIMATIFNVRSCIPYPGICVPIRVERTGNSNRAYMIEPIRGRLAPVFNWTTNFLGNL